MTFNATFISGDTVMLNITAKKSDGTVMDLTGATEVTFRAVKNIGSSASISKTLGAGVTVLDATAGSMRVILSPSDSDDLSGDFLHDTKVIISGDTYTLRGSDKEPGLITIKKRIL